MSGDRFQPRAILTDFDIALQRAIFAIWPSQGIHWCDSFHMVQACVKWLSKNGAPQSAHTLVTAALRRLLQAKTHEEFEVEKHRCLEVFRYGSISLLLCSTSCNSHLGASTHSLLTTLCMYGWSSIRPRNGLPTLVLRTFPVAISGWRHTIVACVLSYFMVSAVVTSPLITL